jgi:hypothetical protein
MVVYSGSNSIQAPRKYKLEVLPLVLIWSLSIILLHYYLQSSMSNIHVKQALGIHAAAQFKYCTNVLNLYCKQIRSSELMIILFEYYCWYNSVTHTHRAPVPRKLTAVLNILESGPQSGDMFTSTVRCYTCIATATFRH